MILRSVDGLVAMSGKELAVAIPAAGEVRYEVSPGSVGGRLDVLIPEDQEKTSGRVILVVPDGTGGSDELVVTSPRTIRVSKDGTVSLTLSEYVQVGAALPAIGAKLAGLEERIALLEPVPDYPSVEGEVPTTKNTGTHDPYAPGLNLCGEKD